MENSTSQNPIFSCIIPASSKDAESQNLKDLISSIRSQDFPQDKIEILVITEGDSESAKAIGIRRAKGEICAMFCADNFIVQPSEFETVYRWLLMTNVTGMYARLYQYVPNDNSLNRYFSLMGCNDPIAFYLKKADRLAWFQNPKDTTIEFKSFNNKVPSLGDNGFYYRRSHILQSDLDHYYPMDAAEDLRRKGMFTYIRGGLSGTWHRTSDNLFTFLRKRYIYARDLYCHRNDRRWKIIDTREDYWRLAWFVFSTVLVVPALLVSARGYVKLRDRAWFWHWPVSFCFLITYSLLVVRNCLKRPRSLFRLWDALRPSATA